MPGRPLITAMLCSEAIGVSPISAPCCKAIRTASGVSIPFGAQPLLTTQVEKRYASSNDVSLTPLLPKLIGVLSCLSVLTMAVAVLIGVSSWLLFSAVALTGCGAFVCGECVVDE